MTASARRSSPPTPICGWHLTAAELVCGVIDETGEYVDGAIDWNRNMDGYRDWMRRLPASRAVWETARFGAPLTRK